MEFTGKMPVPRGEPQIGFVLHDLLDTCRFTLETSSEIGFVLRIFPTSHRPVPPGRAGNWVRFARFVFPGTPISGSA
jgi:hypothetical protein